MDTQLREPETQTQTFAETALKLGGKSEEEARTTGTIDRADDQVEALFAARYQTVNSPVHRSVWDHRVPVDLFAGAGFAAIAFDAGPVGPGDDWARVFEDGTDLWFGTSDPRRVEEFMGRLGFESASYVDRSAVTPPCGLAGQSAAEAREELHRVVSAARSLG